MQYPELAIVLPAWKKDFLAKSLQSIENQNNQNFILYIFDDAGPEELLSVAGPFLERNPKWKYHRFGENMGSKNLAAHWNRCIRLCSEKWIWLFSDDDEMDAACTEEFFRVLSRHPDYQVFRFPFRIMSESGQLMPVKTNSQVVLSGKEFGIQRFLRQIDSSAVEFVFSRKSFEQAGGFPEFPAAWCADDAGWIAFSGNEGMRCMENAGVSWRWSTVSISGSGAGWTISKLNAAVRFINWFNTRFPENAADHSFRAEQIIWLRLQMVHQNHIPGFFEALNMLKSLRMHGLMNNLRCFQDLFCLSYVYHRKVVLQKKPAGIRYWLSFLLPAF
jgi:glycosyltransferase involved in cell wall biosynthesis